MREGDKIFMKVDIEAMADDIFVSMPLTKKQQGEASLQLLQARQKARQSMTDDDMLMFKLLQLKFRLEDYIN